MSPTWPASKKLEIRAEVNDSTQQNVSPTNCRHGLISFDYSALWRNNYYQIVGFLHSRCSGTTYALMLISQKLKPKGQKSIPIPLEFTKYQTQLTQVTAFHWNRLILHSRMKEQLNKVGSWVTLLVLITMSPLIMKIDAYQSAHCPLKTTKGVCFVFHKNNHWRANIIHSCSRKKVWKPLKIPKHKIVLA